MKWLLNYICSWADAGTLSSSDSDSDSSDSNDSGNSSSDDDDDGGFEAVQGRIIW